MTIYHHHDTAEPPSFGMSDAEALQLLDTAFAAGIRVTREDDRLDVQDRPDAYNLADRLYDYREEVLRIWWAHCAVRLIEAVEDKTFAAALLAEYRREASRYEMVVGLRREAAQELAFGAIQARTMMNHD